MECQTGRDLESVSGRDYDETPDELDSPTLKPVRKVFRLIKGKLVQVEPEPMPELTLPELTLTESPPTSEKLPEKLPPKVYVLIDSGGGFTKLIRHMGQLNNPRIEPVLFLDPAAKNYLPKVPIRRIQGRSRIKGGQSADRQMAFFLAEVWALERDQEQKSVFIEVTRDKAMQEDALEAQARGIELTIVDNLSQLLTTLQPYM